MAKYSVGGTEVIDDNGYIDWTRLANRPSPGVTDIQIGGLSNCGTDCYFTIYRQWSGTQLQFIFYMNAGGNCNCNCDCNCNCNC